MRLPRNAVPLARKFHYDSRQKHSLGSIAWRQYGDDLRSSSVGEDRRVARRFLPMQRFRDRTLSSAHFPLRGSPQIHAMNTFHRHQQVRFVSSWMPEVLQNFSIWGGSGFLLKSLHADGALPFWACFATISVLVRTALFPLVLYGAQTSSRFAKVVPEVQFLLTLFRNDMNKLRQEKAPFSHRLALMRTNLGTLGGIYKLHKIHPFSIFLSPLMQLPIFWYISVDLRKIVNGLDPILAQKLVESSIAWVPDLTESDPWFGLPVLAGLVLYANVEVAVGRRSLSGKAASQSDTAVLLKDVFQSFAVFMPCFTAQLPSGVQIYLVTSFAFTAVQSIALRTENFRLLVGLPSMLAPSPEAKYAKEFVQLKKLEQKAREARGNGPVLGKHGILAQDLEVSFAGHYRKSSIEPSPGVVPPTQSQNTVVLPNQKPAFQVKLPEGPYVHGVSAPLWQLEEQQRALEVEKQMRQSEQSSSDREYMPQHSEEVMEKANRGEVPRATQILDPMALSKSGSVSDTVSLKRFKKRKGGGSGKTRKPNRR